MFHAILYKPLLNALILLTSIIPGAEVGLAVIALTIIVRIVLLPFMHKQITTQKKMKLIEGDLKSLQKKHADNKQEQTKAMMALYKEHGINPFAGFALLIIQIPILLALFWVFNDIPTDGTPFTTTDLYSFVHLPANISFGFFGILDLAARSIPLALLVGISQYIQISLSLPPTPKRVPGETATFGSELTRSMSTNMRYVMPVFVAVISASFPSVIALYWLTSNLFMIAHELVVRKKAKALTSLTPATRGPLS